MSEKLSTNVGDASAQLKAEEEKRRHAKERSEDHLKSEDFLMGEEFANDTSPYEYLIPGLGQVIAADVLGHKVGKKAHEFKVKRNAKKEQEAREAVQAHYVEHEGEYIATAKQEMDADLASREDNKAA